MKIKNDSGGRLVVKVKCSDETLYQVNHVFAFIEVGTELSVEIIRQAGPPKSDKLVICTKEAAADAKDAQALFKSGEANEIQTVALSVEWILCRRVLN